MQPRVISQTMKPLYLMLIILAGCTHSADPLSVALQVRGNGCAYDEKCEPHWSWWNSISVRNPEYRCRMMAAVCLTKLGIGSRNVLTDLRAARNEMPGSYDTGDGVISYAKCIDSVINKIEGADESLGIFACHS